MTTFRHLERGDELIGFTSWHVDLYKHQIRLVSSVGWPVIWQVLTQAQCSDNRLEEHIRNWEHDCGLLSWKDPGFLIVEETDLAQIFGVVQNFGAVAEREGVVRASDAVVKSLFDPQWKCIWADGPANRLCPTGQGTLADYLVIIGEPWPDSPSGLRPDCKFHVNRLREIWEEKGQPEEVVTIPIAEALNILTQYYRASLVPPLSTLPQARYRLL